jgi:predicted permease
MSLLRRAYRLLLRLYPPGFRARFGAEMDATLEERWRRHRTLGARLRFLASATADLFVTSVRERLDERRERSRPVRAVPSTHHATAMDRSLQDVRFAIRSLGRRPGFVAAVTLTLALGIGANTAVFSLVDAVLLHPLPVQKPHELVALYHTLEGTSREDDAVPYPLYETLRRETRSLAGLVGFRNIDIGVRIDGRSEQLQVATVSGDYFRVLGVPPQAGRLFTSDDDGRPRTNPVVVLSDEAWARWFNRDARAIGSVIHAGEQTYTIIGVAAPGFRGTQLAASPQLYFPLSMITSVGDGGLFSGRMTREVFTTAYFGWIYLVGRLPEGTTSAQALQELNAATTAYWQNLGAEAAGREKLASPLRAYPLVHAAALGERDNLVRFVALLLAVVTLTLLITCVNVANLMFVRSAERSRELALRLALGARRARIVYQLFVESLLLALAGASAALAVGVVTMRLVSAFTLPGEIALATVGLGLDGRVLAFTGLVAVLAALVFGLIPAVRASNVAPGAALRAHTATGQRRPRGILVALQVAMSLVLLVGATLFVRSLQAGLRTDLGFDPRPLAAVTANVRKQGYESRRERTWFLDAAALARRLPGVSAAAVGGIVPLADVPELPFTPVAGGSDRARLSLGLNVVSTGYFDVLGIPVLEGRDFSATDEPAGARVAIVNAAAARVLAPDSPVIGRTIRLMGTIEFTVVGIVRNTRIESVRDEAKPMVFANVAQFSPGSGDASIVVRSRSPAASLQALQRALRELHPDIPIRNARLVADQLDTVLMPQRFGATLLSVFALVALSVSAVGIYGVVAYGVTQRKAELGIRIALGAQRAHIVRTVALRSGLAVAVGMAGGLGAASVATRGIERFLFGIARFDLPAVGVAVALLAVSAATACWVPVRHAIGVDPLSAIRSE